MYGGKSVLTHLFDDQDWPKTDFPRLIATRERAKEAVGGLGKPWSYREGVLFSVLQRRKVGFGVVKGPRCLCQI